MPDCLTNWQTPIRWILVCRKATPAACAMAIFSPPCTAAVKTKCAFGYNKVIPQPDNCVVWAREKGRVFDDVVTMLKTGKYTLAVSVGSLQGTPQIALPLEGGRNDRRYPLGTIAILPGTKRGL